MIFFARRVAHFTEVVDVAHPDDDTRVYTVKGALFFASSNDLVYQFDYAGDPQNVIIDLSDSQIYDSSTVAALDAIELKYHRKGKNVVIVGLNEASQAWHSKLTGQLGGAH
jgi:SulP family sulfate permease